MWHSILSARHGCQCPESTPGFLYLSSHFLRIHPFQSHIPLYPYPTAGHGGHVLLEDLPGFLRLNLDEIQVYRRLKKII
jgi:hypothetical protein